MAFWKYKPTQGYWSRTLTLVGAMTLVCSGAFWIWNELEATNPTVGENVDPIEIKLSDPPPRTLEEMGLVFKDPDTLDEEDEDRPELLLGAPGGTTPAKRADLRMRDEIVDFNGKPVNTVAELQAAFDTMDPTKTVYITVVRRKPIKVYIQGGVAAVMIIGFLFYLLYMLNKPKVCEFLIATESEMKKVNWPSRKEIVGSTWLVIAGTFMLALLLFLIDLAFTVLFKYAGVLKV